MVASNKFYVITKKMRNYSIQNFYLINFSIEAKYFEIERLQRKGIAPSENAELKITQYLGKFTLTYKYKISFVHIN